MATETCPQVILLDLDETLVVEERVIVASLEAAAALAPGLDHVRLATDARAHAKRLFWAGPHHAYCRRVGISSWEGLWCEYVGDGRELTSLRAWAPGYRRAAWGAALAGQGVIDPDLADRLAVAFGEERRRRHENYPDAEPALRRLKEHGHTLGLVSNGAACLQREKLAASGLAAYFDAVVISADVGAAKPSPEPFARALALLHTTRATMVGDSYRKDIDGARGAGLDAIWLDREGGAVTPDPAVRTIASLDEL